jgi:F0F1-type ATP synthase membrane subunit b/b'
MRSTPLLAATAAAALVPATVYAAEEAPSAGSWLLFAFFVFNFILFVAALVYFAAPFARRYFGDRATRIRSSLDRARSALDDAERLANEALGRIACLEQELRQLADELEAETRHQVTQIAEAARTGGERIRRDTELTAAALADSARRQVRARLADTAAALARELIAQHFRADDQGRLVASFMDRLGQEGDR